MKKRTSAFSIAKTRRRVLFATAMVAGLTVSGLGIKATLDTKGDATATGEMPAVNKLVEINPRYEEYLRDVENGEGGKWTRIPNKYIPVNDGAKSRKSADRGGNNDSTELPASYNLRIDGFETAIKNQGSDGLCWAFSSTTIMESYLKRHGMGNNIEFSPKQLDYLRVAGTPVGNYVRDVLGAGEFALGTGYNFLLTGLILGTTGKAPVKEADFFAKLKANDPNVLDDYQSWNEFEDTQVAAAKLGVINPPSYMKPMDYSDVISNDVDYLVTDYSVYATDTALIDLVKNHVRYDGAVELGTFAPDDDSICYDEGKKTIIDLGDDLCNPDGSLGHAMSIVGWDDTYEYTYTDPVTRDTETRTGAFILQNSWGKTSMFTDLGLTNANEAIEAFGINAGSVSEEWKEKVNKLISTYDPPETFYYAYIFNSQDSDFGLIDKMVENTYDAVFGSVDGTGFEGLSAPKTEYSDGITINDETFTFSTGNQAMQIDAIGVNSLLTRGAKTGYKVEIDTGKGFKELGTLTFESGRAGQSTIKLSKPEVVKGDFKLKVGLCVYDEDECEDTVLYYDGDKDGQTNGLKEYDHSNLLATVVYLNNYKGEAPKPEPEPEPEKEEEWTLTWLQEQTHTVGNGKDLIIKVDLPISEFKGIEIDDKDVDKKNYTVTSGSTIITIPSKYADTLKAGKHKLGVDFKTSYIITNFTIKGNSEPASKDTEKEEDKNVPADIPDTSAPEEKQPAKKETTEKTTKTGNTGANAKKAGEGATEVFLLAIPIIFAIEFFVIKMYKKD